MSYKNTLKIKRLASVAALGLPHHCVSALDSLQPCNFLSVFFESTLLPLWIFPPQFLSKIQSSLIHFFLIQISGIQYCVFVLNWKRQTYGVVKQLSWSCTCSDFLSVSFSSRETGSFGFRKDWFFSEETHPLFRHLYCFRQRFCRAGDT